ncbi:MAG TPA: carbohydrate ABC transporter permease [Thermomicrobiales bacterium]|nr:carbohydrate ABC transporter permease [Thermomicrobiales bacterium]
MSQSASSPTANRSMRIVTRAFAYLVISAGAVLMVVPFLWMASTAFKEPGAAFDYPPTWIPDPFSLENFREVWTIVPFDRYLFNSLFVAVCITVGEVLTSALAAYAFARLRFPGRDAIFLMYLATLMIPGQVTIIPNFILMRWFGWIDTYQGLIIPTAFTAFGTFLLRQYFLSIPRELEEAARVDGASYFQVWSRIIMPLASPAIATLAVFSFMGAWNSFLWPYIMINSADMRTITVALRAFQTDYGTEWGLMMAGSLIAVLPMLAIFLAAQRYFVRGIATTGFGGR